MKKLVVLALMVLIISPINVQAKTGNAKKKNFVDVILAYFQNDEEQEDKIIINDDFTKIDESKSEYTFTYGLEDSRYVIIKQAKKMVIWTEKEIQVENQEEFLSDLKVANKDNSLKDSYFETAIFIYGEGLFDLTGVSKNLGEYTFEIVDDNTVKLYCDADKISHANYGTYINKDDIVEEEKEYVWEEVERIHTDSATGYGLNNYTVANSWFVGQILDFSNTDKIVLDIQAGNPKNGTNFVGKVSLTKNNNVYTINYSANDVLPDEGAYKEGDTIIVLELSEPKYLVSLDKISISNQGKDLNTYVNGDTFIMDSDVFHFYTHFNVESVTYKLVEKN